MVKRRGGSLLFYYLSQMEIGVQLVNGFVFGFRLFHPTESFPYSEVQLFVGPICFYIIWD